LKNWAKLFESFSLVKGPGVKSLSLQFACLSIKIKRDLILEAILKRRQYAKVGSWKFQLKGASV